MVTTRTFAFIVTRCILTNASAWILLILTLVDISTAVGDVGIALVALAAVADVPRPIGGVTALTVGAHTRIAPRLLLRLVARQAITDGPVQPHRHRGVDVHVQVSCVEGVDVPVHQEGVVAGCEAQYRRVVVLREGHVVVGDVRGDIDAAAPDAGAGAVGRAAGVVAEGHAAGVVGVTVVAVALALLALGVAQGVAADDDELVVGVGDAVHVVAVEVHVAVAGGVHFVGGVEALPRDGELHAGLRRLDVEEADRDELRGAGERRRARAAVADDLEAISEAARADAERIFDGYVAAAGWAGIMSSSAGSHCCCEH